MALRREWWSWILEEPGQGCEAKPGERSGWFTSDLHGNGNGETTCEQLTEGQQQLLLLRTGESRPGATGGELRRCGRGRGGDCRLRQWDMPGLRAGLPGVP